LEKELMICRLFEELFTSLSGASLFKIVFNDQGNFFNLINLTILIERSGMEIRKG